jgi:hypothetical protein
MFTPFYGYLFVFLCSSLFYAIPQEMQQFEVETELINE